MSTLEITTNIGCTLACTFCPQDKISKLYKRGPDRSMSLESFKTIISKVPKHVRIDFSGYSEPFLNENCMDLIDYAIQQGFSVALFSTLENLSISNALKIAKHLESNSIKFMVIHLPDNEKNMPGFTFSNDYLMVLELLLACENVSTMTMSRKNRIKPEIIEYFDNKSKKIKNKLPKNKFGKGFLGWRRGGSLDVKDIKDEYLLPVVRWKEPVSCAATPFYDNNVVVPNGNVHLCCMDYSGKHVLGNLISDSYESLFQSKEFGKVISVNMKNEFASESICKSCEDVLCHKYDKKISKWEQYRPGHLEENIIKLGFGKNRAKSLTSLYRNFVELNANLIKFLRNKG